MAAPSGDPWVGVKETAEGSVLFFASSSTCREMASYASLLASESWL